MSKTYTPLDVMRNILTAALADIRAGGPGSGRHKEIEKQISKLKPKEHVKIGKLFVYHKGIGAYPYRIGHTVNPDGGYNDAATPSSAASKILSNLWKHALKAEEQPLSVQKKEWPLQGKTTYQGLKICIENKKGSIRSGKEPNGKPWSIKMPFDYGYVAGTEGKDRDEVDCFIGPFPKATHVYVVHQRVNKKGTPAYDEDKCFLGWDSADAAKKAYHSAYNNVDLFHSMTMISIKEFKEKLKTFSGKKLHASLQAGGKGSGRHKELRQTIEDLKQRLSKSKYRGASEKLRSQIKAYEKALLKLKAGGVGSGRKKSNADPKLKKILQKEWKDQTDEERRYVAQKDPSHRQHKLFEEPFNLNGGGPGSGRHKEFLDGVRAKLKTQVTAIGGNPKSVDSVNIKHVSDAAKDKVAAPSNAKAFYNTKNKTLYVDDANGNWLVATQHEFAHHLANEHFGMQDTSKVTPEKAALLKKIEGEHASEKQAAMRDDEKEFENGSYALKNKHEFFAEVVGHSLDSPAASNRFQKLFPATHAAMMYSLGARKDLKAGGPGSGRHPWGRKAKPSKELTKLKNRAQFLQKHSDKNREYLKDHYDKAQAENKSKGLNSRGKPILNTRQQLALKNMVVVDKAQQDKAEEAERLVTKALHGVQQHNNSPMDVVMKLPNGKQIGLEVKTLLLQKNDKITMKRDALARKTQWGKDNNSAIGTVVLDLREKGMSVFYRSGVGSFRVMHMQEVQGGLKGLASVIGGK